MNEPTTKHKIINTFLYFAGVVLFLTAVGKLIAAGGSSRILNVEDPLLMLSNKQLMIAVGVAELALAGYLFFGKNILLKTGLVTWLATNFGLYKIGLVWIGARKPCGCLGSLSDALGISANTATTLANVALGYLLIGGIAGLIALWSGKNANLESSAETPSESSEAA